MTGCCGGESAGPQSSRQASRDSARGAANVAISTGSFLMGDTFDEGYPADGERPVHEVTLRAFAIDATVVSNAEFATFVDATGYVTDAERYGYSAVFGLLFQGDPSDIISRPADAPWWLGVRDAQWRRPQGRWSSIEELGDHPVVHVSWHDAEAYCRWSQKRLPTEAEWERAARGGLSGSRFAWGDELTPRGQWHCNIWQGDFPSHNTAEDGYLGTAPVRTYQPNGFGLWNMAGNVWEWCADWFAADYYAASPSSDPLGPASGSRRVLRGGSYLCHDSYCHRYRVAARSSNTPDSTASNIGFRCASDGDEQQA